MEKNNKIYKQNYIMFIPLAHKIFKENGYEEKRVQYDIDNVIKELSYKEKKTIFFINKFLETFKKIMILDEKNLLELFNNKKLRKDIFGTENIPQNIDDVTLAISSLDYVDLLIRVENILGVDVSEYMSMLKLSIGELAKRIVENE